MRAFVQAAGILLNFDAGFILISVLSQAAFAPK